MEPTLEYQDDFQEAQESQQETQSTQEASQDTIPDIDTESLWGYLQPCSADLLRLEFNYFHKTYTIGRNDKNIYVLPGVKVSESISVISLSATLIFMKKAANTAKFRGWIIAS
jgi:serine/threonine/tyrosine protein kinase RAD53